MHKERYERLTIQERENISDVPPEYVPLSMLVPPVEIGKIGTQRSQVQVFDSPRSNGV